MLKQILLVAIVTLCLPLFCETKYEIIKKDGTIILGSITEDKPGEYLVINENLGGQIIIIKYEDLSVIKPFEEQKVTPDSQDTNQSIIIEPPVLEVIVPILEPKIEPTINNSDGINSIKSMFHDLSLSKLTNLDLNSLDIQDYTPQEKEDLYNSIKKDDTLKYTLLNFVPGLGSMLQGDYYAGFYTISSVLTSVVYNLAYNNTGNDLYFILNLNGVVSYLTSFVAPLRYNQNYNKTIKDKLSL